VRVQMTDASDLIDPQPIPWKDGGRTYSVAPCDTGVELWFQKQMRDAAWDNLPSPGHPARAEAADALLAKFSANEYAFGGPICLRYLSTYGGQGHYLHLLMHQGFLSGHAPGAEPPSTPPAAADLARRLRRESEAARAASAAGEPAPATPLLDVWHKAVARDFPFLTAPAVSSSGTTGTPEPSTSGSSPSCAAGGG
jgi:hypothetical protein